MPMRLSLRLVVAGLASLLVALVLVVGFAGRPTPSPTASAAAGAQAWAMIDHLFHVDGRAPGTSSGGPAASAPPPPTQPAPAPAAAVAQLPPAAAPAEDGGRFAAIDRHASAPRPLPAAAATPAPVVVAPPVAAPPAPVPGPATTGSVSSAEDERKPPRACTVVIGARTRPLRMWGDRTKLRAPWQTHSRLGGTSAYDAG